jgi:hypothetical protein
MGEWVGGAEARMRTPVEQIESSVVEVLGQRLVELEVGEGLGIGGVEARRLVEQEGSLGRAASGRERRRPVGEVEVQKNSGDDRRVGEKGEDLHGAAAGRAEERQDLVDAGEEHGPSDAGEEHGPSDARGSWRAEEVRPESRR